MKTTLILATVLVLCLGGFAFAGSIYTPVSHWAFDEISGTTAHDSAGSNDGAVSGATWVTGKIGGALDFDGLNDYVNCGSGVNLDGMNAITLSAWINIQQWKSGEAARIISKRHHPDNSYELTIESEIGYQNVCASFYCEDSGSTLHSPQNTIGLNEWYHLVATNSGSSQKIYINGIQVVSANVTTGPIRDTNANLWIGRITDGYVSSAFNGLIDDVRIYDYALSANEVSQLYQIPEPATLIFLGAGIFGLLRRK